MPGATGGQLLAEALAIHGARFVFTVPGNSVLGTLDGLRDREDVGVVVCRHEGGAAFMAEAQGRLTGGPGVCLVTRGPGATNASIGVLTAREEGTPMVLLVGDVGADSVGRDAFQELDAVSMFQSTAKWAARIPTADRIPELVSRAFHVATSGRPGPVVLSVPEDVQLATTEAQAGARYRPARSSASAQDVAEVGELLAAAASPLLVLGGRGWTEAASADIRRFAELQGLPVVVTFRRQDVFDNEHPSYIGTLGVGPDPALLERVQSADVLLLVGGQLGEVETGGYRLVDVPHPRQTLIHVAASAEELGKVYRPRLGIAASVGSFAAAACGLPLSGRDVSDVSAARKDYDRFSTPKVTDGGVDLGALVHDLSELIADDAIVAMGAGNYTHWLLRYRRYRHPNTLLAPIGAPMGYSTPAAIAAGLLRPDRDVLAFAGDGCFLMNGQELATAVQYGVRACFIVIDNGMLASVRMRQERLFPERDVATDLVNPDFVELARAYGVPAASVTRTGDFAAAYRELRDGREGPILLHVRTSPENLAPGLTLDDLRRKES